MVVGLVGCLVSVSLGLIFLVVVAVAFFWLVVFFSLVCLFLMLVGSFVLVEICSFRTGGRSANTIKGSSNTNAFTGSTLDGSLPVTARWLQPGPLGKNPH